MAIVTPPYHFAMVVQDLDAATSEFTRVMGLTWAKTQRGTATFDTPDGLVEVDTRFTYSLKGPPHLELIERRAGTLFAELGLHHLGVWSDDPVAESARLEAEGWPRETVAVRPDGSWAGSLFHQGPGALRFEVVDIGVSGPKLARFLNGGDYA